MHIPACMFDVHLKFYFAEFVIFTKALESFSENLKRCAFPQDPTAVPYVFQDDPYLIPTSAMESVSAVTQLFK